LGLVKDGDLLVGLASHTPSSGPFVGNTNHQERSVPITLPPLKVAIASIDLPCKSYSNSTSPPGPLDSHEDVGWFRR
jgi:hypothetical protein